MSRWRAASVLYRSPSDVLPVRGLVNRAGRAGRGEPPVKGARRAAGWVVRLMAAAARRGMPQTTAMARAASAAPVASRGSRDIRAAAPAGELVPAEEVARRAEMGAEAERPKAANRARAATAARPRARVVTRARRPAGWRAKAVPREVPPVVPLVQARQAPLVRPAVLGVQAQRGRPVALAERRGPRVGLAAPAALAGQSRLSPERSGRRMRQT